MGVDEFDGDEVGVRDGVCVCDGERVFEDCLDGSPDVDDLVAAPEEGCGFGGEMVRDSVFGRRVGLVDVYALDGAAEGGAGVCGAVVLWLTADGVVEDEDFGGAGSGDG